MALQILLPLTTYIGINLKVKVFWNIDPKKVSNLWKGSELFSKIGIQRWPRNTNWKASQHSFCFFSSTWIASESKSSLGNSAWHRMYACVTGLHTAYDSQESTRWTHRFRPRFLKNSISRCKITPKSNSN